MYIINNIDVTKIVESYTTKMNRFSPESYRISKKTNSIEITRLNRSKRHDWFRISIFNNLVVVENKEFVERFVPPMAKKFESIEFYTIKNKKSTPENLIVLFNKHYEKEVILMRNSHIILCELSDKQNDVFFSFHKDGNSKINFNNAIREAVFSWSNPDRSYSQEDFFKALRRAKYAYFGTPSLQSMEELHELKELAARNRKIH